MSFLDEIMRSTVARVAALQGAAAHLERELVGIEPPRDFGASLRGPKTTVIAEIKRATPLKGPLDLDLDAATTSRVFAAGGAAAISVLTEPDHFKGSLEDLTAARGAGLPVLRKDFIVDELQVLEARAAGADAVLVIVRIVDDAALRALTKAIEDLGMDALVEVHDEPELERALGAEATLIGVNHRDLGTFEVDPDRTAKLAPEVPSGCTVVALSGVTRREEVIALGAAGAHSVLVGETLVTAADPAERLRELLGR